MSYVEKFNTKKWLTSHIEREHHQNASNSNVIEKPKIGNGYNSNNNRTLLVGPPFSRKINLMLKIFSWLPNRDIYKITKLPPEQYSNSKIKINQLEKKIKPLNEYEKAILVFDDILASSNGRYIDQYFIGGWHNNLSLSYHRGIVIRSIS